MKICYIFVKLKTLFFFLLQPKTKPYFFPFFSSTFFIFLNILFYSNRRLSSGLKGQFLWRKAPYSYLINSEEFAYQVNLYSSCPEIQLRGDVMREPILLKDPLFCHSGANNAHFFSARNKLNIQANIASTFFSRARMNEWIKQVRF